MRNTRSRSLNASDHVALRLAPPDREGIVQNDGQIVERFLHVAQAQPEAPAVRTIGPDASYADLANRAGGIVHALTSTRTQGPVMLLTTSGIDLAASALAALALGRPAVPVDPLSGADRTREVAAMVGACAAVISSSVSLDPILSDGRTLAVVPADAGRAPLEPREVPPDTVAIVGFTSGSSGAPRPRARSHGQMLNRLLRRPPLPRGAISRLGMLQGATASTIRELLTALLHGDRVSCLDARNTGADAVLSTFAAHEISRLFVIPTYLRRLCTAAEHRPALSTLRLVTVGGEPLSWVDIEAVRERLSPDCAVLHVYGAAETGRVTTELIGPEEPVGVGAVPVGHPEPGMTVWVAADDGTPTVPGTPGEVVVDADTIRAGADVEKLDDGRFRYWTGDVGVLLPDGRLTVFGRRDRTIKAAGIRIEPARIEEVMRAVAGASEAAVVARADAHGRVLVVAHLAGGPAPPAVERRLLEEARKHLHAVAVPTRLVWHPAGLPTLPNGKCDLPRLSRWEEDATDSECRASV
jgi:acyl-coenzyme A synthetase/AMP-(fatty) acid ligase